MKSITFDEAVRLFIRDRTSINLSPESIKYYHEKLRKLKLLLEAQGITTKPHEITTRILREHCILHMMEHQSLKISTIHTYLRAWKAFFNFLVYEELLPSSPFNKLRMPKVRKTVIQTFTKEQLTLLLQQPKTHTFAGVRDFTMILLFLETGVRVREMTEITLDNFDWERNSIRVRGKGDKERLVYFQDKMRTQLITYLGIRGRYHIRPLFIATWTDTPLTRRDMQYRLKQYGREAGINNVRVSPHTLRHTFARMSVENQVNVFSLQTMLGHTTMNQVLHYVNLFSNTVKDDHRKSSPLENFLDPNAPQSG